MARTRRVTKDGDAYYHVISRITGKQFLLASDEVKGMMRDALERVAEFSGVLIGNYSILDNHFHILCAVRDEGTVPEEEVLRRIAVLRGERVRECVEARLASLRSGGGLATAEVELNRWRRRMGNLSEFVKTFKETFGLAYRRRHAYVGTLWDGRFKSVLVEEGEYVRICARYIDMNSVRAGLGETPEAYRWCARGAATHGDDWARACVEWLEGEMRGADVRDEWEERVGRTCAQLTSGKILGSMHFVAEEIARQRGRSSHWGRACARAVGNRVYASHGYRLASRSAA